MPEATRWRAPTMRGLRHARSCYGHLAGELGVHLRDTFVKREWVSIAIDDGYDYPLTGTGAAELKRLDLPLSHSVDTWPGRLLYGCVDWSERRDHFAGPLAVMLLDAFIERGWLRRHTNSRLLDVTPVGQSELIGPFIDISG